MYNISLYTALKLSTDNNNSNVFYVAYNNNTVL